MIDDKFYDDIESISKRLHINLTAQEIARLATENHFSESTMQDILGIFQYISDKKDQITIDTFLKLSRLPIRHPKTFDNFDFTAIRGKNAVQLTELRTLSAVYAHKNIIFIGPAGTGKTHLAQAFGYECCKHKLKAYFIKMSELRDKFLRARAKNTTSYLLADLVRPSCLIIDEVGHCQFDKENTQLFFDLVDRRYNKEGCNNMIFTSNKEPSSWRENFSEDNALLCTLDRIFDDAMVFELRGNSFRGQNLETYSVETERVHSNR